MGGSQHLHYKNFYCNGITGGMVPIGVGIAYSIKFREENGVVLSFMGDGAMNEGYVMEAMNLASIFKLPVLFILENNSYAMSTYFEDVTSGTFEARAKAFNIGYDFLLVNNVYNVFKLSKSIISQVREKQMPFFLELKTHRFCGHSKSDKREYISSEIDDYWRMNDPLFNIENELPKFKTEEVKEKVNGIINRLINNLRIKNMFA